MEQHHIQALLVTPDPLLARSFTDACTELGIEAGLASSERIHEEIGRAKWEAVLVDFDTQPESLAVLAAVRQSPSNRNAILFAVATHADQRQQALANGITLLFERPFDAKEIRRVLHGAYELMVRERRRYFRCVAEIPALLIRARSGTDSRCTTMNVSSSGAALRTPFPLEPGDEVQLILFLQGTDLMVRALGTVVWDDKHGKTGISFECTSAQHQSELDSWLDAQFHPPRTEQARLEERS